MAQNIPDPAIKKDRKNSGLAKKNEIEADWEKARGFLPLEGEIIVYNPDDNHDTARLKVGDGSTPLIGLPFIQEGFIDSELSDTSENAVQNKVVNTALAGKANTSHTHNIRDVSMKTAFNIKGNVDYISRSLIPYVSGTKFYGMPAAAITVEYSRDGGTTWVDYGLTDAQKMQIFDHSVNAGLYLGKATKKEDNTINNMLRITIDATKSDGRYLSTDSMFTWISSQGSTVYVTFETATYAAPTTFKTVVNNAQLSGWSGPNISHYAMTTFGGSTAGSTSPNNQIYRLTYKQTTVNNKYPSAIISDIRFFVLLFGVAAQLFRII